MIEANKHGHSQNKLEDGEAKETTNEQPMSSKESASLPEINGDGRNKKSYTRAWKLIDKHCVGSTRAESGKQRLGSVRHDFCHVYISQFVTAEYDKHGNKNPEPVCDNSSGYLKRLLDTRKETCEVDVEAVEAEKENQPFVKFINSAKQETALCLDFDHLDSVAAEKVMQSVFATPYQCIGNTTSTTTLDNIKLHLCFPLAHAVEQGTVHARIQAFCDKHGFSEYVDRRCLSAQRGWYIPTKHVITPRVFVHGEGRRWLDITEYASAKQRTKPKSSKETAKNNTRTKDSANTDYTDFDKVVETVRGDMMAQLSNEVVGYLQDIGCRDVFVTPHRNNVEQLNVLYKCPEQHKHDAVQSVNLSGIMYGEGCRSEKCNHRPKPRDFDMVSEVTSRFFSRVACFHLKGSTRRFWLVGETVYTDSMLVGRLQQILCGGLPTLVQQQVSRLRLPQDKHDKAVAKKMRMEVNGRMSVIMQTKKKISSQQVAWNGLELPVLDSDMQFDIWEAFKRFDMKTKLDSPYIHVLDDKTFNMSGYGRPFNCYQIDGNNWKLAPMRGGFDSLIQDRKTDAEDKLGLHDTLVRAGYLASWTFSDMVGKLKKLSFAVTVHPKPDFDAVERQLCRQRIFLASARGCHVIVQAKKGFNRDTNSLQSFLNIAHRCRSSKPKLNNLLATEQDPLLDVRARYASLNTDMFKQHNFKVPDMAKQYIDGKLVHFQKQQQQNRK